MAEVSEIIEFLKDKTGIDDVSENSDIGNDLGIDGDDYEELIKEFSKQYHVDTSSWLWYFHCREEGSWNSIGGAFFESPDKRVKYIPVTPLMLSHFTKVGKWNLEYPEHTIPKRRYDIILNTLLVLALLILLFLQTLFIINGS